LGEESKEKKHIILFASKNPEGFSFSFCNPFKKGCFFFLKHPFLKGLLGVSKRQKEPFPFGCFLRSKRGGGFFFYFLHKGSQNAELLLRERREGSSRHTTPISIPLATHTFSLFPLKGKKGRERKKRQVVGLLSPFQRQG